MIKRLFNWLDDFRYHNLATFDKGEDRLGVLSVLLSFVLFSAIFIFACLIVIPFIILYTFKFFVELFNNKYRFTINLSKKVKKQLLKHEKELLLNYPIGFQMQNYSTNSELIIDNKSLDEFLVLFFNYYNDRFITLYNSPTKKTFICDPGKRRSLGDIFLICKYYFPKCNIEDVLRILLKLATTNKLIAINHCSTIHKMVFFRNSRENSLDAKTEYGNLTLKDLINIYGKE